MDSLPVIDPEITLSGSFLISWVAEHNNCSHIRAGQFDTQNATNGWGGELALPARSRLIQRRTAVSIRLPDGCDDSPDISSGVEHMHAPVTVWAKRNCVLYRILAATG